jgi:hypothetical protein
MMKKIQIFVGFLLIITFSMASANDNIPSANDDDLSALGVKCDNIYKSIDKGTATANDTRYQEVQRNLFYDTKADANNSPWTNCDNYVLKSTFTKVKDIAVVSNHYRYEL